MVIVFVTIEVNVFRQSKVLVQIYFSKNSVIKNSVIEYFNCFLRLSCLSESDVIAENIQLAFNGFITNP